MSVGAYERHHLRHETRVDLEHGFVLLGIPLVLDEAERDVPRHRCVADEDVLLGRADVDDRTPSGSAFHIS